MATDKNDKKDKKQVKMGVVDKTQISTNKKKRRFIQRNGFWKEKKIQRGRI